MYRLALVLLGSFIPNKEINMKLIHSVLLVAAFLITVAVNARDVIGTYTILFLPASSKA